MIRAGHANAWDYPMEALKSAIKELEEAHRGDA
jgi:hypothetical protein